LIARRESSTLLTPLESAIFIAALIIVIFAVDIIGRWWRENEWRRRWRERERERDDQ
jgi:hypothetical protein